MNDLMVVVLKATPVKSQPYIVVNFSFYAQIFFIQSQYVQVFILMVNFI